MFCGRPIFCSAGPGKEVPRFAGAAQVWREGGGEVPVRVLFVGRQPFLQHGRVEGGGGCGGSRLRVLNKTKQTRGKHR